MDRDDLMGQLRQAIFDCPYRYEDLAQDAGISLATIYAIRSGKTAWPRPHTLFGLCRELGLELHLRPTPSKHNLRVAGA